MSSLELAIRKALERAGPGADATQRARIYQSARNALENGLRQQKITEPAVIADQRRQLEAAIHTIERDARLDFMEYEAKERAAREEAEREERRRLEVQLAEEARLQAEQAREQAERDAELRRRRMEIDRERAAREAEYEAAQRALRDRIAAREQAAREQALKERERLEEEARREDETRRLAEEAAERERAAREQAERERQARDEAERQRLERERIAREEAERQRAERERQAQEEAERHRAREAQAQAEAAARAEEAAAAARAEAAAKARAEAEEAARRRAMEEDAARRRAAEEAEARRRAAEEEAERQAARSAPIEHVEPMAPEPVQLTDDGALGGVSRDDPRMEADAAPAVAMTQDKDVEFPVENQRRDDREPVFDIVPDMDMREERRAPSFDFGVDEPEPAAIGEEPPPAPAARELRAVRPRKRSRWKARAFVFVTLAAFAGAGWWWVETTGMLVPVSVRGGAVPNPAPQVSDEDFDGAKQLKSLSRQGGYGDEWTTLYEPGGKNVVTAGASATAKVEQSGSGPYLDITSGAVGLDGSVAIELPQSVISTLQGKTSNISLMLQGGDKPVQITVECEFGGLGNCGRHRFMLSQNKNDFIFDVAVKPGASPDGPGRLLINADAGGEANSARLYSIHILPGG